MVADCSDDIVGGVTTAAGLTDSTSVRVFAAEPDTGRTRELGRFVLAASALYTPGFQVVLVHRQDRVGRLSDHIPFLRAGDPALRFTERNENILREHVPNDDLAHTNAGYTARVARLNGAFIGALGLAPPGPDTVIARRDDSSGGQRWNLTWSASPGAVRYEVLLRWTGSPTWERIFAVGSQTNTVLDQSLDEAWAGVRAVGANGARSPVVTASMVNPPFRPPKGLLSETAE